MRPRPRHDLREHAHGRRVPDVQATREEVCDFVQAVPGLALRRAALRLEVKGHQDDALRGGWIKTRSAAPHRGQGFTPSPSRFQPRKAHVRRPRHLHGFTQRLVPGYARGRPSTARRRVRGANHEIGD